MMDTVKLSIRQFLEAMSDDNRFYTSRKLNKRFEDVTVEELINHYLANAPIGMTIQTYEVSDDEPLFV